MGRCERSIYLPRGPCPQAVPPELFRPEPGTNRQGARQIPRPETDLSGMPVETEMLPEHRCQIHHSRRTRRRPSGCPRHRQNPPIRHLNEAEEESGDALRVLETHPPPRPPPIARPLRRKRRILPRRKRPEPPQTGQNLSCTAANAQSLNRKARARSSERNFLRQQHTVFPQNRRRAAVRCGDHQGPQCGLSRPSLRDYQWPVFSVLQSARNHRNPATDRKSSSARPAGSK